MAIHVETPDEATVLVPPGSYRGGEIVIEGDASAATYHAALATLHGGCLTFTNLGNSTRKATTDSSNCANARGPGCHGRTIGRRSKDRNPPVPSAMPT